mmetsp:Transcript_22736/g.46217  ORF Transcript_22736/g.46217 Transcript_22736/m.46217 type:complete len:87 (+) Transcript_22736:4208-4468(+)
MKFNFHFPHNIRVRNKPRFLRHRQMFKFLLPTKVCNGVKVTGKYRNSVVVTSRRQIRKMKDLLTVRRKGGDPVMQTFEFSFEIVNV